MALPDIQLDNRSYTDLVNELRRRIPAYTPEWTDYNESDPGIALIELFSWLADILVYRINQVPDKAYVEVPADDRHPTGLARAGAGLSDVHAYFQRPSECGGNSWRNNR